MSPSGLDVILYEYLNRQENDFNSYTRKSIDRFVKIVHEDMAEANFERGRKALQL